MRVLTAWEQALARQIFGRGIAPERVRLLAIPLWNRAFVAGPRLIVWPAAHLPPDFALAPLPDQGLFVHELTHVWQAQRGVSLILGKIKAGDGAASYAYDLAAAPEFPAMNIEQQAMVVQHAFLASRGVAVPHPLGLYAEAARHWRES